MPKIPSFLDAALSSLNLMPSQLKKTFRSKPQKMPRSKKSATKKSSVSEIVQSSNLIPGDNSVKVPDCPPIPILPSDDEVVHGVALGEVTAEDFLPTEGNPGVLDFDWKNGFDKAEVIPAGVVTNVGTEEDIEPIAHPLLQVVTPKIVVVEEYCTEDSIRGWLYRALAGISPPEAAGYGEFLTSIGTAAGDRQISRTLEENQAVIEFSLNVAHIIQQAPELVSGIVHRIPCSFESLRLHVAGIKTGLDFYNSNLTNVLFQRITDVTDNLSTLFHAQSNELKARDRESMAQAAQFIHA